jgi:hypothetical protein
VSSHQQPKECKEEQQHEQEKARNEGTPRKVAGGTGRLSMPQPGVFPKCQEGEKIVEDIARFPEGTDEDRYVKSYKREIRKRRIVCMLNGKIKCEQCSGSR